MKKVNIFEDIEGIEFPAGRRGRVIIGSNGAIEAKHFCQGYSVIYPGGGVPAHNHPTEETYTILSGTGEMMVDGETLPVKTGDCIYVDKNLSHSVLNTGDTDMHMMYVYAPKMVVDHWAQEMEGILK